MGDMGDIFRDLKEHRKKRKGIPRCFTDYPLLEKDKNKKDVTIREVDYLSYDGNKYCRVAFGGDVFEIKSGYLYAKPGKLGEVPKFFEKHPDQKEKQYPT